VSLSLLTKIGLTVRLTARPNQFNVCISCVGVNEFRLPCDCRVINNVQSTKTYVFWQQFNYFHQLCKMIYLIRLPSLSMSTLPEIISLLIYVEVVTRERRRILRHRNGKFERKVVNYNNLSHFAGSV